MLASFLLDRLAWESTTTGSNCTYIICNMSNWEKILLAIGGYHEVWVHDLFVIIVLLIHHHIVWVDTSEGDELLIITVSCCFAHLLQTNLKCNIDIFWGRCEGFRRGIGRDIFTLWVASNTSTRVNGEKAFVLSGIVSHMVNDVGPDLITALFVTKDLVGEGGKEAVAYPEENC
jgi:hypothetical protein